MTTSSARDQRRLPFAGATNFRDLGGYRTRDGGTTRWATVYRADGLQELTDDDLDRFEQLGIRMVYDLRRDEERDRLPNRVSSFGVCIASPIVEAGVEPFDRTLASDELGGEGLLRTMYVNMLDHSGRVIGTVLGGLADRDALPAVFHCHAGKDRTGIVAALLLEALGVDRETVLDDYELTASYRSSEHDHSFRRLVDSGMVPEAAAGVIGAPRWAMNEALERLDQVYGGIERYLRDRAGLDAATLARLRAALVAADDAAGTGG